MAWDSYSFSQKLDGDVELDEFRQALEGNLRRVGSLKFEGYSSNAAKIVFRPKGAVMRAKANFDISTNKRTNVRLATITGTTNISILIWLFMVVVVILTSGILFPIFLLLILFSRKSPREDLENALKNTAVQV